MKKYKKIKINFLMTFKKEKLKFENKKN